MRNSIWILKELLILTFSFTVALGQPSSSNIYYPESALSSTTCINVAVTAMPKNVLNYTKLTQDYLSYWDVHDSEINYQLFERDGEIKYALKDSSILCYDESKCNYLHLHGHGYFQIYIENKFLKNGNVTEDNPELIQLGNCDDEFDCDDEEFLKLIYVESRRDSTIMYNNEGIIQNEKEQNNIFASEATATMSYAHNDSFTHTPALKKTCIDPNLCTRVVGSTTFLLFNSSSNAGLYGNTYHGSERFGNESNCKYICDDKPPLSETSRGREILLIASSISSMTVLSDINTPNYLAACWIINDDFQQLEAEDTHILQRYTLALIYFSTGGSNWFRNMDFLSPKSECDWNKFVFHDENELYYEDGDGVHCDEEGFVTKLILNKHNLIGEVVPEISWLIGLEKLDLGNNHLFGTIPEEFDHFENMEHIIFAENHLSGSIPQSVIGIDSLKTLHLHENHLSGTIPSYLGKELGYISMYGNMLTGIFPEKIGDLTNLTYISAFGNLLSGPIPLSLEQLWKLQYLDLGRNQLSSTISSTLFTLPILETIRLSDNNLSGSIPSQCSVKLNMLYLDNNSLTGTIPSYLANLSTLKAFHVQNNFLTGQVPSELTNLKSLEYLQLQFNSITGTITVDQCEQFRVLEADCDSPQRVFCSCCTRCHGLFTVHDHVEGCPSSELTVEFSFLEEAKDTDAYLISTAGELVDHHSLIARDVTSYKFSTCISISECYKLNVKCSVPVLISVFVDGEYVIEEYIDEVQTEVYFGYSATRKTLQKNTCDTLNLCNSFGIVNTTSRSVMNKLVRETGLEKFDLTTSIEYIALCHWTKYLSVIEENFLHKIKSELLQHYFLVLFYLHTGGEHWYQSSLWLSHYSFCEWYGVECDKYAIVKELSFDNNNLKGVLPTEIRELRGLTYLSLKDNNLRGSIPSTLGHLPNLKTLKLSHNSFKSDIPVTIGFLANLVELDLSQNTLTNSLPSSLGYLRNLEYLNFFNNSLSSDLPSSFYNLTSLKYLSIGDNYLIGDVSALSEFRNLEYLDLSANFFSGSLPISTTQENLRVLEISSNDFFGTIPSSISALTKLEKFCVQNNRLSGSLPSEIGNLSSATHLSISYNLIRGEIPSALGNLEKLELFHLHSNKLVGDADLFSYEIDSYIADCGNMFRAPASVKCESCTTCCNRKGNCLHLNATWPGSSVSAMAISPPSFVFLSIFAGVIACVMLLLIVQNNIKSRLRKYRFIVSRDFQKGSAYRFFMSKSHVAKFIGLVPVIVQLYILATFTQAADFSSDLNDWQYSISCQKDSFFCNNTKHITISGRIIFALIIFTFLGKDLFQGVRMICESDTSVNIKGVFAGFVVTFITCTSILVSTLYNFSTGVSDTDVLKDAVILLFLNSIDEQTYEFVECFFPAFVEKQEKDISESIESHIYKQEEIFKWNRSTREISEIIDDIDHDDSFNVNSVLPALPTERFTQATKRIYNSQSGSTVNDRIKKLENELVDMRILLRTAIRLQNGNTRAYSMEMEASLSSLDSAKMVRFSGAS